MAQFAEDNLQRIMMNPFYVVTVASQLTTEHDPPMGETEWVQANASLIKDIGAEKWIRQLLDVLEGKAIAAEKPINPVHAVNIDPLFAAEHPPIIEKDMWVDVNVMQLRNLGAEGWLRRLLDVLGGDVVTAEEVGLAPPPGRGGPFGYQTYGRDNVRRSGKQKRKKRHRK